MNPFDLVRRCIREMERWMLDVVRGFRRFDAEDRDSYAAELSHRLVTGRCACGLARCPTHHALAAQPASGLSVPLFVRRAVIGSKGLKANSVAEGMFYRLILQPELGMLVALVEFKRCHNPDCRRHYETERCPADGCGSVFTPQETEVFAEERLLIQGKYGSVRRWGCSSTHYYQQQDCWEVLVPPFTEFHPHVLHGPGGAHDRCPWCRCPNENPPHGLRGTTLWVRQELAGGAGPSPPSTDPTLPLRLEAYEEGTRRWLSTPDEATRERLHQALAADPDVDPASRDDPLVIAGWVLGGKQTVLSAAQVNRLREEVRRVLAERGLDDQLLGN